MSRLPGRHHRLGRSDSGYSSFSRYGDGPSWTTNALVDNLSSSPTLRLTAGQLPGGNINVDENIFPLLPPLLRGHPDVHLRNGVMNASRSADPDAENAFFVADLSQVYRQHLRWQACLPEIQPFYAVKCNPDPYVLRLLAALGTGFDCASNGEISQIPGYWSSSCVSSPTTPKSVCAFNNQVWAALATELNLGRRGSELPCRQRVCYDPSVYTDAAGYQFSLLDVGGGFEDALFEQAATFLTDAIATYFPDRRGIKVIAEPGRFYVSKAFSLATNIIARRAPSADAGPITRTRRPSPTGPSVMCPYINDGVYGAFNCILFDHQTVHPYVLSMGGSFHVASSEPVANSSVWGPDVRLDRLRVARRPSCQARCSVGDWLGFDGMGAYTVCAASQFKVRGQSRLYIRRGDLGRRRWKCGGSWPSLRMADGHGL
ncbi:ornithine decarboxylase [Mycena olivaceomarginata]|nr:ornithine decarboxylase [Mycena olivaceomarginata]